MRSRQVGGRTASAVSITRCFDAVPQAHHDGLVGLERLPGPGFQFEKAYAPVHPYTFTGP
jgi:hypothetical protein